jgi:WD40 repeat protein
MASRDRLLELLVQWEEERRQGRAPTAEELCPDDPALQATLRERIRQRECFGHLWAPEAEAFGTADQVQLSSETELRAAGTRPAPPGSEAATFPPTPLSTLASPATQVRSFGQYELLEEIGRGGMGVVYKARQLPLGRLVALKMVLAGGHTGAPEVARFRTEAEAIARQQHPNIVQIFEIGEQDGLPFLSLEFCSGGGLDRKLAGTPLPPQEAAQLVEVLARAMEHAHRHGVLHRDLKPANVLLTEDGTPKITDFGLAKKVEEAGQTATGAVMGTPSYMTPEQALGKSDKLGPTTDVYALGAILYECLTGRAPFKAATALDTVLQVINEEPVPPMQLNAKVPRDLQTICLTCLRKEPGRRYAGAVALAEDLERFQKGVPVRAQPVGMVERSWRWCRRNQAVALLVGLVALLLVLGTAASSGLTIWAWQEKDRADTKATEALEREADATRARDWAERLLYISKIQLVRQHWESGHVGAALQGLQECRPELRGWEHGYLRRLCEGNALTFKGHTEAVTCLSFSPDGRRLASAAGFEVKVWDAHTGQEVRSLKGVCEGLCFLPGGGHLATGTWDRTVKVWDVNTGREVRTFDGHTDMGRSICISADGRRLASADRSGTVKVWDVDTGREVFARQRRLHAVCLSPDGHRLAGVEAQLGRPASFGEVKIWDVDTGQEVQTLKGHAGAVAGVCFRPDGKRLACASMQSELEPLPGEVKIWDADTGQEICTLKGHAGGVTSVSFRPDGRRLASASQDQTVKVWDADTGRELQTHKGHTDTVRCVSYSPVGDRLASASLDQTVRIWEPNENQEVLTLKGRFSVCFRPDGRRLASAGQDNTVKIWDVQTGEELISIKGHTAPVLSISYHPDGRRLAVASGPFGSGDPPGEVKIWDADAGREIRTLPSHPYGINSVCFSPDGHRLAGGSGRLGAQESPGEVKVWDVDTGREILTCQGHLGPVLRVDFSPDGRLLASASFDRTIGLWDAQTGKEVHTLNGHKDTVTSVCFSPDGKLLASTSLDKSVTVWDVATGLARLTLQGHPTSVNSVSFSPDGKRLASASGQFAPHASLGEVKIWDVDTGQEIITLETRAVTTSVSFSPGGKRLASASLEAVKVWEAGTGRSPSPPESRSPPAAPDGSPRAGAIAEIQKLGGKFLTTGYKPTWSPDGTMIAFSRPQIGDGIGRLDLRTGTSITVVKPGKDPAWCPGAGEYLAYVNVASGRDEEVWLVDLAGTAPRRLAEGGFPSWSPDGQTLIYHSRKEQRLKVMRQPFGTPSVSDSISTGFLYPSISPDGRRVALRTKDDLCVVDLESRETVNHWPLAKSAGLVAGFSPDSQLLGFGGWGAHDTLDLSITDLKTGCITRLLSRCFTAPVWSPDGSKLTVDLRSSGNWEIWLLDARALSITSRSSP